MSGALWIDEILGPTKTQREVNYIGFGLRLHHCSELASKIAERSYSFDKEGKEEFEMDLVNLNLELKQLYMDYLSNKREWAK